ncbi:MAG: S53 family peptidase [Candidatus Tyrphobacter sp.]
MKIRTIAAVAALAAAAGCSGAGVSNALPSATTQQTQVTGGAMKPQWGSLALPGGGQAVCTGGTQFGVVQCPVLLNTLVGFLTNTVATLTGDYPGLHPADLRAAYDLPSSGGSGSTVAIVDKGDDPNAESDLAVYRKDFRLPACTSQNGCFRKVTESGGTTGFGAGDQQWAAEISLDLDMVSAVCPQCHILLVEANSANISDFGQAVDTAVRLGATEVSNSYYTNEFGGIVADDEHYDHPGVPITASAGDGGYGVTFPASSQYVTAVGGTTLTRAATPRGWAERVWRSTGSGCSVYFSKPAWQTDSGCSHRTVADVAVVGDPTTGVAVYNTYAPLLSRGWGEYGGTSVGAPVVAAIYALAGNASSISGAAYLYAHGADLNAVTAGSNGVCTPPYLCTAGPGYDGPAGLGTPHGTAAF